MIAAGTILNFVYNHAAPRLWREIYFFDLYSLFGEISVPYGTCGCPKPLLLQTGLRRTCFLQPALRFHISPNRCSATALGLQFILIYFLTVFRPCILWPCLSGVQTMAGKNRLRHSRMIPDGTAYPILCLSLPSLLLQLYRLLIWQ